jgi:hypothetical protein
MYCLSVSYSSDRRSAVSTVSAKLFQQFLRKSLSLSWGPVVQILNRLEQLFVSPVMANV